MGCAPAGSSIVSCAVMVRQNCIRDAKTFRAVRSFRIARTRRRFDRGPSDSAELSAARQQAAKGRNAEQGMSCRWIRGPARRSAYDLFLNRQLSLPVSTVSQWCARRPPCSPDLNLIEQAFAKLKRWLRDAKPRCRETLRRSVGDTLDKFKP